MLFYFHPGDLSLKEHLIVFFLIVFLPLVAVLLVLLLVTGIIKYYKKIKNKKNNEDLSAIQDQNTDYQR